MALSEETIADKVEVIGEFQDVQVRTATVIYRDDEELTRSFHRHVIHCQTKTEGVWGDTDVSGEYQNVQDDCNSGIWTTAIKTAYREHIDNQS